MKDKCNFNKSIKFSTYLTVKISVILLTCFMFNMPTCLQQTLHLTLNK